MLIGLLRAIKSHPFANFEELGKELNVPGKLIRDMVDDLTMKGYLKSFKECDSACDHCEVGSYCSGNTRPKMWMLTEKGQQTVQWTKF